jgi:hypothetical protein
VSYTRIVEKSLKNPAELTTFHGSVEALFRPCVKVYMSVFEPWCGAV